MKLPKTFAAIFGVTLATTTTLGIAQQTPRSAPIQSSPQAASDQASRPVIRTLRLPPERLSDISTALGIKYGYQPGINISADTARGELVILAPHNVHPRIDGDIQQMLASGVVQQAGGVVSTATTSRLFPLRRITWREFEDNLQVISGGRLPSTTRRNGELASFELVDQPVGVATIEVDRRANSVTVVAPEPAMAGWRTLIQSLDLENAEPGRVMQLATIHNAEPAPIQQAIRLLRQLKVRDARGAGSTVGVAGNDVRFMGTGFAQQDTAAANAAPQNGDAQNGDAQNASPQDDGNQDDAAQDAADAEEGEGGLFGDVQIQFVPELGVIIVRGAKRDVERVMEVIDEIERQAVQTQPKIEVVQLQYVDSEAMAELVTQLYTGALSARGANLSVTALVKPNALLLIGREEAIREARALIAQLDTPVDASTQLRVFRLTHASAVNAEETIRGFFSARPGIEDDELRPGLGTRVRLIADYRTNSLVVQAAPRDMAEVARLIEELDVVTVPAQNEIRVFPLKNALAEELQPVLQEAINGQSDAPLPEGFTQPSTTLAILAVDAEGNRVIDSGLLAGVVVSADANANALVVRAPSSSMALISELIRQLDQLPGAESVVKVFQLQNSDAGALSQALTNLFSAQTQTTGGGFGGFGGFGAAGGIGGAPVNLAQAAASPESSLVPLRFSIDPRTNSIIAVGSMADLEVVESIILRLDIEGFATRQTEVIWLRNADADAVAIALSEYVAARNQTYTQLIQSLQVQGGSAISVYDFADRDLIVVPELNTNSLLISVSPRLYDSVMRLIDQLDRRPPMVMVRVILAEVSLSDGFEWGSEFGIQDSLLFDRGVAGTASNPGFNFNNGGFPNANQVGAGELAGQSLSTFGLGRASQQFGYGGFVLAAASESVSLLLRSLQDAQRLQILSRPMIMTKDNTIASIQVGQTVPIVTGVVPSGLAGVQVVTTPTDIGLLLNVLPRVGSDGLIRMEIQTERSNLSAADGVPIGTDANGNPIISPIINRTRADTVVTAFSGQTVVFGGLIQKSRSQTSRRIPYVSSIPVLGALFRYDIETESRDELLIIMTPMIVNSDEDLEYIKQEESSRMSYCLADLVEMHGDVGLSGGYGLWGPAVGPMIYPDMTPTIDDIEFIHGGAMGVPIDPVTGQPYCPPGTPAAGAMPMQGMPGMPVGPQNGVPQMPSVIDPAYPVEPGYPVDPVYPVDPAYPVEPAYPVDPVYPVEPAYPVEAAAPIRTSGHVRQVQHSAPRPATPQPRRLPPVR